MRVRRRFLELLALTGLLFAHAEAIRAQQRTLVVRSGIGGDAHRAHTAVRLERQLATLIAEVRRRSREAAPYTIEVVSEEVGEGVCGRLRPGNIALAWGSASPDAGRYELEGFFCFAPNPSFSGAQYVNSWVSTRNSADPNELGIYVVLIGYALMLEAWARRPELAEPWLHVLQARFRVLNGQPERIRRQCMLSLWRAIDSARNKVQRGEPLPRRNVTQTLHCHQ